MNTAMQDYHGYNTLIFGLLMFRILQGVCVWADQKTLNRATGSSLELEYPDRKVSFAEWKFNDRTFAEYGSTRNYTFLQSQFSGRLIESHEKVGVTIQNLQPQDSGTFLMVATFNKVQLPTQTFKVYVKDPITDVQIKKNQMWRESTNSCDVNVKCAALGAERVSYLWSGYKTGSGAQLQFSLSPADGDVTLNCTASNNVSNITATETLRCKAEPVKSDPILKPEWIIAVAGGAAVLLIIAVIIAVWCWWKSHKDGSVHEGTVYADVNPATQKNTRSDSVNNGMTVYETVDDLRAATEMTIYAKVTLPQHTKVSATPSSPYQQVL